GGGSLRGNVPAENRWYSRVVTAMARFLGLSPVAPYFVDQSADGAAADSVPENPLRWPVPGRTIVHLPSEPLAYALTWYALAAMTAAALAYGTRQEWRRRRGAGNTGDREDAR